MTAPLFATVRPTIEVGRTCAECGAPSIAGLCRDCIGEDPAEYDRREEAQYEMADPDEVGPFDA